jgi:hypothetical protein
MLTFYRFGGRRVNEFGPHGRVAKAGHKAFWLPRRHERHLRAEKTANVS